MSKIDRVLGNHQWKEGDFDHTPMVVCFFNLIIVRKPFKFYKHWGKNPEFADTVSRIRSRKIHGHLNFQILKKMQLLKHTLKAKLSKLILRTNSYRLSIS